MPTAAIFDWLDEFQFAQIQSKRIHDGRPSILHCFRGEPFAPARPLGDPTDGMTVVHGSVANATVRKKSASPDNESGSAPVW